jgi:hypothetical protein
MPSPVLNPLWWTDGVHVLPLGTSSVIRDWITRGVSYGWVVAAVDEARAKKIGEKLDKQTKAT